MFPKESVESLEMMTLLLTPVDPAMSSGSMWARFSPPTYSSVVRHGPQLGTEWSAASKFSKTTHLSCSASRLATNA